MNDVKRPGWLLFATGVVYPAGVIGFELIQEWCAEAFFDPMPSVFHGILIAAVPLTNFLLWQHLRGNMQGYVRTLSFFSALSIGVAACYTLIFLPLTPLALVGIIYFGIGLLPLAPLVSLVVAIVLYRRFRSAIVIREQVPVAGWKGAVTAILTLFMLDIPSIAAHQGIQWAASESQQVSLRGVQLLRSFGDEDILLRRCYDQGGRASGPLGLAMSFIDSGNTHVPTSKVRETFFRVTGEPFNSRPPPYSGGQWDRMSGFEFDGDQGGTEVGGRIKGLHLTSSRIDGSVSADDGVAYLEWTLEFRNDSSREREVRLQLALPPQSVTSRATLWVNGEEREAAFAGRAQATQAYQSVVRRQRDPLLVTTRGSDRLQAQAFPLPRNGGTIKFRLGFTAPLEIQTEGMLRLVLPTIVDRNFVIGSKVRHMVWVEGQQPLQTTLPQSDVEQVAASQYRVTASVDAADLSRLRQVITTPREGSPVARWAQVDGQPPVTQKVVRQLREPADALVIVLDGSVNTAGFADEISSALEHIPDGSRVGMIIAGENENVLPIAEWTSSQRETVLQMMASNDFVGGQDNAPALTRAFRQLEQYENGQLLWIHLPQPIEFGDSSTAFEQALTRLSRLPETALYSLQPGPNVLLDNGDWELSSRTVPRVDGPEHDLADYFAAALTATLQYRYQRGSAAGADAPKGSSHIARLWARDEVHKLLKLKPENYRDQAIAMAARFQLVTTISGAVVLENAGQYEENDLNPVNANSVPTIPEPEQWILALIVLGMMLWMMRRNSPHRTARVP